MLRSALLSRVRRHRRFAGITVQRHRLFRQRSPAQQMLHLLGFVRARPGQPVRPVWQDFSPYEVDASALSPLLVDDLEVTPEAPSTAYESVETPTFPIEPLKPSVLDSTESGEKVAIPEILPAAAIEPDERRTAVRPESSVSPQHDRSHEDTSPSPAPSASGSSPQAWYARLVQAAGEQKHSRATSKQPTTVQPRGVPSLAHMRSVDAKPERTQSVTQPIALSPTITHSALHTTRVSESTRRFLRPLVGVDPASVRVHQGEAADRLTSAHAADALTVGDEIVLASGHPEGTPETLGVLAHELTHVARQQNPRFVPPVIRRAASTDTEAPHRSSSADHEETLAQQVETQIRQVARAWLDRGHRTPTTVKNTQAHSMPATPDASILSEPAAATRQEEIQEVASSHTETTPSQLQPATRWGRLPAPWEPLPEWVTAPQPEAAMPLTEATGGHQPSPALATPGATVQRAAHGRTITEETEAASEAPSHTPEHTPQPEPDLDALARQVYAVLKRRLATERRREG